MREILNVWFKSGVVHTPLAQFHLFSLFLMKSRHTGISHPYGISLLSILEGWNSSYIERGKWNAQGPRGGYVRRQIWTKHYTFQKILCREKFLEMFKIAQLLKKKVFQKIAFFGAISEKVVTRSARHQAETWCKIVKSNAFLIIFFSLDQNLT